MNKLDNNKIPITTPCIGICSTVFGDTVCRGCKRYDNEIINWNSYLDNEKRAIDDRLQQHLLQILNDKFSVINSDSFEKHLINNNVRYMKNRSSLCWVSDLLRTSVIEEAEFQDFSIEVNESYKHLTISALRDLIDEELLSLSQAHYDRYMVANKA